MSDASYLKYDLPVLKTLKAPPRRREEPGLWRETAYTNLTDSVVLISLGIALSVADIYENIEFLK